MWKVLLQNLDKFLWFYHQSIYEYCPLIPTEKKVKNIPSEFRLEHDSTNKITFLKKNDSVDVLVNQSGPKI